MKKTLSLLLVLAMVLSSFSFAFAAEAEKTPGEILKDLGVLTGNAKGDLMLEDELSRQDMIVLLSRVLGQEDEAKAFKGEMSFTDVNDSFYKPYIAWAEANKLTNGVEEGKFGFGRAVTEQEVATLMLRALGYNDVEFKDVPAKAVELGLAAKDADLTVNCKRARMAEITLAALGTKMNGSEKTLAESLGLELPKPEKLEVVEVKADNLKEIKVVFNKAVDRDVVEDRDLYNTTAGSIKDIKLEDENTVVFTLADGTVMTNKKEYKLTIRGFKDAGAEVNKEFKFKAYDNTVPEVVDVVGLGTKAIKVVMSEPIKEAKSSNFKIDGKTYYGAVKVDGREIVLKPYGSSFAVGDHKLVVATLEDYAGFKSIEKEVEFTIVEDKEAPTVVEVKGTLERVVVTFSEDVDDTTVTKDSLYWGGVKSNKAQNVVKLAGNRYAFEFSKEKALPTYEVALTIKGVKDYSGNEMTSTEIPFKAEIDQTRPEVLDAYADDETTIIVEFNKPVDANDVKKSSNYTLTDEDGKKVSLKNISLSSDGKEVTIALYSALKEDKDYTFKISGIRDNTKLANSMLPYETTISAGSYNNPYYTSAIGNNADRTIFVSYSKKMDVETISNPTNYLVVVGGTQYLLSEIGADVDVLQGGKAVLITLPKKIGGKLVGTDIKFGTEITNIVILAVKDLAGNNLKEYGKPQTITTEAFSYLNEEVVATAVDENTVELEFKRPVVEARSTDFDSTVKIAKVDADGSTTVVVTFEDDIKADLSNLTLKIKADNKIESITGEYYNVGDTAVLLSVADEIAPSLEKAKVNVVGDNLVITATFDEPLAEASELANFAMSDFTITRVDGTKVSLVGANSTISENVVTISVPDTQKDFIKDGYAYGVEITKPAFVRDASSNKNVVNKTDEPVYTNDLDVAADKATEDKANQAAVDAEAAKYETTATIASTVAAQTNITDQVVRLKAGKTANNDVTVSYSVVEDATYLDIKGEEVSLKAINKTDVDVNENLTITFTKGGKTATATVVVTIEKAE